MSAYRHRLELTEEGLRRLLAEVRAGLNIPADPDERERCRLVADRAVAKARELADRLSRSVGDALMAEAKGTIDHPDHREPGEEP